MGNTTFREEIAGAGLDLPAPGGFARPAMSPARFAMAAGSDSPTNWRPGLTWADIDYVSSQPYLAVDPNSSADETDPAQQHLINCYLIAKRLSNRAWDNLLIRSRVKADFSRGKINIWSPLVIPPYVDGAFKAKVIRRFTPGNVVTTYTGDTASGALGNLRQPAIILTPASCAEEINLHCDGDGGTQANGIGAGSGVAIGKCWTATNAVIADQGVGYSIGDTLFTANPDSAPFVGAQLLVTNVNGSGGISAWTLVDGGVYGFPIELQKRVWTANNGFTGIPNIPDTKNYGAVFSGANHFVYGGSGVGATATLTWKSDFPSANYDGGQAVVGDTVVGNIRVHGVSRTLSYDQTYGATFGVTWRGLNHFGNSVCVGGGYWPIDINGCNDVFYNILNCVGGKRGVRVFNSGNINCPNVVIDSSIAASFELDRSGVVNMNVNIFWSDGNRSIDANAPATSGYNILVGAAGGEKNTNCDIKFRVGSRLGRNNPAGSPLAFLDNSRGCEFELKATNVVRGTVLAQGDPMFTELVANIGAGFESSNTIRGKASGVTRRLFSGAGLARTAGASFTGSAANNVLTVSTMTSGTIAPGQMLEGHAGLFPGVTILPFGTNGTTGTGQTGTYALTYASNTVPAATAMTSVLAETAPRCDVQIWDDIAKGYCGSGGIYSIADDGIPSASTGKDKASPGSSYLNRLNGDEYVQVGAINAPSWKIKAQSPVFRP